jgi:hypothetical protein
LGFSTAAQVDGVFLGDFELLGNLARSFVRGKIAERELGTHSAGTRMIGAGFEFQGTRGVGVFGFRHVPSFTLG